MKIVAIIAEFNPLHKGHEYIIGRAREITGCERVLVIQSGNFTQRAEPAVLNKFSRAKSALLAGADAVVEMPTLFATGNAEVFAKAGVKIACSFENITHLVFGTEADDIQPLSEIATVLVKHQKRFRALMKPFIKEGLGFDKARCEVVKRLLPHVSCEEVERTMLTGNNKLGIEYLRELLRLKSSVVPVGVKRIDSLSATQIRKSMHGYPNTSFQTVALHGIRVFLDTKIYNSNQEIVNLIRNLSPPSFKELKEHAPTKRYSVSRISRLALHSVLGVTKKDVRFLYRNTWLPYTNLLAVDRGMLAILSQNEKTPVLFKGNKVKVRDNKYTKRLREIDARAGILYEVSCGTKLEDGVLYRG